MWVWFYQPLVSNDKLLTGTKTCTQKASGKILLYVIKCVLGQIYPCGISEQEERVWIGRLSYLEYLKPIDVEHTHDLMASFSLCLQGRRYCQY